MVKLTPENPEVRALEGCTSTIQRGSGLYSARSGCCWRKRGWRGLVATSIC